MISEAIIAAAGLGLRLTEYSGGKPKFAAKVHGRPLIAYPLAAITRAGIKRVTVVVPGGWREHLLEALQFLLAPAEVSVIENHTPSRDNGYTLLLAEKHVSSERFLLSMCDHVYTSALVTKLIASAPPNTDIAIGADRDPKFIDINEATKILADERGAVKAIGKDLTDYNYIDVGVFVLSRRVFDVARDLELKRWSITMSDVVTEAVGQGYAVVVADVTEALWTEVDTPADVEALLSGGRRPVLDEALREVGGAL